MAERPTKERPAFVYLHGFASGPSSAKAQFFREKFESIDVPLTIPDLNEGEGGFEGLTISRSVQTVQRHFDELAADRRGVVLIGSSLGGYTSALLAARDPRVVAAVLMAPAFDLPARWTALLGPEGVSNWRSTRKLEVDHYAFGRKAEVGFGLYLDAMGHQPYPSAPCPMLIFHGIHDTEVDVGTSRKYASLTPSARLIEMDSDHGLLDQTERIWEESRAFLAPWLPG